MNGVKIPKSQPYVPYVPGVVTSEAAAATMIHKSRTDEARVLAAITSAADQGLTCDEVEQQLHMPHQSASARIRGLKLRDQIEHKGLLRPTRTGRMAQVWHLKILT